MRKGTHKVHVSRRQIDSGIARARQFEANDPRVIEVRYESKEDLVSLYFADGFRISIPRMQLQGLEGANQTQLSKIEIVAMGLAFIGHCSMSTITCRACLSIDLGRNDG